MARERRNRKKNVEWSKVILYSVIVILIVASISILVYQWYNTYYGSDYNKAISSQLANKCSTPPGYTDAQWKQHMSHHPDMYKECLA